jgi:poly(A) polymerase
MTRLTADWLARPAVREVFDLFAQAGCRIYAVGGCVRNTLLERPVSDIDMATDARPDRVIALAEAAGLRAVPTGVAHGTVTLVVAGEGFEVTTFRDDVETDGRHAVVRFSDDLETDARRRDFTMNALYAAPDGTVIDVVGGLADVARRKVRFIGDADQRLREDYLRALRYFRFFAWYGDPEDGVDAEALAAIAGALDGMALLSRERVTAEMLKLLAAPDPAVAVAAMGQVGLLQALFGGGDPAQLARVVHAEAAFALQPDPLLRLAALALPPTRAALRLSRAQERTLAALAAAGPDTAPPGALGHRLGARVAAQALALRAAIFESPPDPGQLDAVARGAEARFPISAADLMPGLQGKALGAALARLEAEWIASDFTLTRDALLDRL